MENPPRKNAAILNVLLLDFNNQVFFQQDCRRLYWYLNVEAYSLGVSSLLVCFYKKYQNVLIHHSSMKGNYDFFSP
jgi:hypothetical protein